jgi:hypothetical protein
MAQPQGMSLRGEVKKWMIRFRDLATDEVRECEIGAYNETDAIELTQQCNGGPISVIRLWQETEPKPWVMAAMLVPLLLLGLIALSTCSRPMIYGNCYAGYRDIDCN